MPRKCCKAFSSWFLGRHRMWHFNWILNYYAKTNESEKKDMLLTSQFIFIHIFSTQCAVRFVYFFLFFFCKIQPFSIALLANCCPIFNKYFPCFVILLVRRFFCSTVLVQHSSHSLMLLSSFFSLLHTVLPVYFVKVVQISYVRAADTVGSRKFDENGKSIRMVKWHFIICVNLSNNGPRGQLHYGSIHRYVDPESTKL